MPRLRPETVDAKEARALENLRRAEARIVELEAALREIMKDEYGSAGLIAQTALAKGQRSTT